MRLLSSSASAATSKDIVRQVAVVVAFVATLIVNWMANALPLNGRNTGQISDSFDVFFVPAGYVFSIWGVIYLALLAFTVYQALPSQRANPALRSIGWLFVLSCVANSTWIFLWHYGQFPLTVVVMLILLATLAAIYWRLNIGVIPLEGIERWVIQLPFSIYLGWITVATIANFTTMLYSIGWDGWGIGAQAWAVIMLGVAIVLASIMAWARRDAAYLLVLVWAFIGIMLRHSDGDAPLVAVSAGVAAAVVALLVVMCLFLTRRTTLTPRGALS